IVRDVFQTLKLIASEKSVHLRAEGLETLPELVADERRLYTALYNLVINAIPEVSAGGTITVSGRREEGRPWISIFVEDDGRGMTREIREALFTAKLVTSKAEGTGFGTKIVKDVVDAHGGEISVESELGKGTKFRLRLPLHARGEVNAP